MSLKSILGLWYRGLWGMWDTLFDTPEILPEIKAKSIGKTVEGREIYRYKFGNGKKKILYFGGIHGNEVGTVKLMNRWVNYLFQACPYDSEKVTVYVIPCLNLDGYEEAKKQRDYFHGGRKGKTNARNVDLNRNFPTYNWSKKSKLFVAGKRYEVSGGQKPASEPEISSLIDFIEKKEISRIYTFHSRWETVFSLNADKRVRRYSDLSGYRIFLMGHWHELSPEQKTGHSMIWGKEQERKIIEVELATRWSSEWKKNKLALIDSVSL